MLTRHIHIIILVVLVTPLFAAIIIAQPLNSVLLHSTGVISYPPTQIVYVKTNATATYELNSAFQVITQNTNSLTVLNHAIGDVSALKGSLFVYGGTYQVNGTIRMQSNVNMTLQDGVFINETGIGNYIFYFNGVSDSSIFANSSATIHGRGAAGDSNELGIRLHDCKKITISASQPNGLTIYNIGNSWIDGTNINDSVFQNLHGYLWLQSFAYTWHGAGFDGLNNVQIINMTSDGLNGDSRSCLLIGGSEYASNNVNITGGWFGNSQSDNGIYLGGWTAPVSHINIVNVTTAYNDVIGANGHSGIKIRPASYVNITGWTSIGDYQGMEMGTCYDTEGQLTGSHHNYVQGVINNSVNVGLILSVDGTANLNQTVNDNEFHLNISNCKTGIWMSQAEAWPCTNNILLVNFTSCSRNSLKVENGLWTYNNFYCRFLNCGSEGYTDIYIGSSSYINHNNAYVYSTSGNRNGLLSGIANGTNNNFVYYPYQPP